MTLSRGDFAEFFTAVNDGYRPFRWQERLLDHLLERGRWPSRVTAPTGAGKTSVIDVHVFAAALMGTENALRLPRRLALVVGRRVLVDDQHQRAQALARRLREAVDHPVDDAVGQVARALAALRRPAGPGSAGDGDADESPLEVSRLRGGLPPPRSWRDHPTACSVICATPDMWGSRLLFRGYGTWRHAAPREAGVLAFDSVVIVDEAHLSAQLLVTARRVATLATVAEMPVTPMPALQVVETTATPAEEDDVEGDGAALSVGVVEADLAEPTLADRLTRPKPVTLLPVSGWPPLRQPDKVGKALADAVAGVLQLPEDGEAAPPNADDLPPHTVGCFVNTVSMAVAVSAALRARRAQSRYLRVVMVCGQTRPHDLYRLEDRYPRLLSVRGNPDVDVIVSTQSLEVGVDLDLAAVVTELAPCSALAQRAGRANRRGLRAQAAVIVAVPQEPITEKTRSGPYAHEELAQALTWIERRAGQPAGLAPWAMRDDPPPPAPSRRTLHQRPELADAWHWARTSDDLAAEPQLDLWLAESFDADTSIGLVLRDAMPVQPDEAIELVRDLPPRVHEVFPVPYSTARAALTRLLTDGLPDDTTAVRLQGEEASILRSREGLDGEQVAHIRPGDLVVMDSRAALFSGGEGASGGFSPLVVVAEAGQNTGDDVLHRLPPSGHGQPRVMLRLELGVADEVAGLRLGGLDVAAKELAFTFAESTSERRHRLAVRTFLDRLLETDGACSTHVRSTIEAAHRLLSGAVKASDVIARWDADGALARISVIDRRRAGVDEDLRQVFSTRPDGAKPVTLEMHQSAVAERAVLLGKAVGLPELLVEALRLAGVHHDEGKADTRFQRRLSASDGLVLAKSPPSRTVRQVRDAEAQAGLPAGWRHEQLSALKWLISADLAAAGRHSADADLVARLIGTSHGHGRSSFPHSGKQLLDDGPSTHLRGRSIEIFDHGGWDELMERTQLRYGVWGCAYLEALLRAADGQISGEGS